MSKNGSTMRRSEKLSNLLRTFEEYLNEVVTSNHGIKPHEMSQIVTTNFRRAIQANIDYHAYISLAADRAGETTNSTYHKMMAEVYKSFVK
jgi:hypothetical protein